MVNLLRAPGAQRQAVTASAQRHIGSSRRVTCSISGGIPNRQARAARPQQPAQTVAAQHTQRLQPLGAVAQPRIDEPAAAAVPLAPAHPEALLCQRFRGHSSATTAAFVLTDTGDRTQIITASLDKSIALWSAQGTAELPATASVDQQQAPMCLGEMAGAMRIAVAGAPVFSLALDSEASGSGLRQVFLGTAAKKVLAWEAPQPTVISNVQLGGHTGWVRALATHKRWLFSCSCNTVQQWDMSRAVPRQVDTVKSFTGDILAACTGNDTLFTAGADGALRSWTIDCKSGQLRAAHSNKEAHTDRITATAWHAGFLYTASADGSVRMWDASLDLVTAVKAAHDGGKVHCLAVGPDHVIYTGGEDKLIRRWQSGISSAGLLAEAAPPLFAHHAPVRTLAAGPKHTIVSGDSRGDVAVWRI